MIFFWLVVALAALDAENLWLPNWITFPGIALGLLFNCFHFVLGDWLAEGPTISISGTVTTGLIGQCVAPLAAADIYDDVGIAPFRQGFLQLHFSAHEQRQQRLAAKTSAGDPNSSKSVPRTALSRITEKNE